MTETLYRKVGRKYVPFEIRWTDPRDGMKVGTFRLCYAYSEGGKRYEYDVRPDTAGFVAAATLYRTKIEAAIKDAATSRPVEPTGQPYTKRQKAVLDECRAKMAAVGLLHPIWWQQASDYEISQAAIDAMKGKP